MFKYKQTKRRKAGTGCLIVLITIISGCWLFSLRLHITPPVVSDVNKLIDKEITLAETGERVFNGCFLRQSNSGLWEMYLEGNAFERGIAAGKLGKDLLKFQEDVFIEQIKKNIPSEFYLKFLRIFIGIFNRNLAANIPEEFKEEIYGMSLSCSDEYNYIGSPYERQLNYHAAHDLGHALQDFRLVGCTSFAAWGDATNDSTLLIGRNFDFYAGDDFAKNKMVVFYAPKTGYKFVSVSWAGMSGVLSGMNEKGLTVTINAAKSSIPFSSATPVSILCREILQYASTLEEAKQIASKRKLFVSESILIGSAVDDSALIIEKSPEKEGIYQTSGKWLACANHFQSEIFQKDKRNIENIRISDSPYRQQRMEELIVGSLPLNHEKSAFILRNKEGLSDVNIGLGNEKSINQLIAHHSVIFKPKQKQIWVSTSPWQIGEYVCYDLNKIFNSPDFSSEIKTENLTIAADTFLTSTGFKDFLFYREYSQRLKSIIRKKETANEEDINRFISSNPEMYLVYNLTGDYYFSQKKTVRAHEFWKLALEKEIPTLKERELIQAKLP